MMNPNPQTTLKTIPLLECPECILISSYKYLSLSLTRLILSIASDKGSLLEY
jgi:hypothetical protein